MLHSRSELVIRTSWENRKLGLEYLNVIDFPALFTFPAKISLVPLLG